MCSAVEVTDLLLMSRGQARGNGRRIVADPSHLNMHHPRLMPCVIYCIQYFYVNLAHDDDEHKM
jgi:hypothetical protein